MSTERGLSHSSEKPAWPLSEGSRAYLESQILGLAAEETPELESANPEEVRLLINTAIELTTRLEAAARQRPKKIYPDTDAVWVLSAPGSYSSGFQEPAGKILPGDKHKSQYLVSPWVKEMFRHRVRTGIALVHEITATRTGKPVQEVTVEDVKKHGPWIVYNPQPEEEEQIREVLADPALKIPTQRVFIFSDVLHADGTASPIYSTVDQVKGLRFPILPRRVAVVSHAPHLARVLFTLDYFRDRIPQGTTIQAFPLKTPPGGELKYPEMEIRAILAYIYRYHVSGKNPVEFEF